MKSVLSGAVLFSLVLSAFTFSAKADSSRRDLHKNLKFDLDGDGHADTIALKLGAETNKFQLTINGVAVSGQLLDEVAGFYIANIDRADKFYEVVVYTPGPSDDDEHMVYWYDGKKVHRLAHLERWVKYYGDGTLMVTTWAGFWEPKDLWTLTANHELRRKPRTFYPVNIKATTTKATPLHASIGGRKAAVIPAKRSVLIERCNPALTWYYVKVGNKSGWLSESELYDHLTGMPVAD